ncbi:MAG: hypothetical protein V1880_02800 [Patescibacteria group bacterium]
MNIYCFSSEDFRPKRLVLVYESPWSAPASSAETPPAGTDTKREIYGVKADLAERVRGQYESKKTAVVQFIEGRQDYSPSSWQQWNKEFAKSMPVEGVDPRTQVRALQQVVFEALELTGDPDAVIDGKLGPYTLAALARYARLSSEKMAKIAVPNADANTRLFAKVEEIPAITAYDAGKEKMGSKDYAGALTDFQAAEASHPGTKPKYNIAVCLDKLNRHSEALAAYRAFIYSEPDAEKFKTQIAKATKRIGKLEKTISMWTALDDAKKKNPNLDVDNSYVVKVDDHYEVRTWLPVTAGVPDVQRANRESLNSQKAGETITLNIDGVPVKMTRIRVGVFTVEGIQGEWDMPTMYQKAIEAAAQKRLAEKPKGTPASKVPLKPAPQAPVASALTGQQVREIFTGTTQEPQDIPATWNRILQGEISVPPQLNPSNKPNPEKSFKDAATLRAYYLSPLTKPHAPVSPAETEQPPAGPAGPTGPISPAGLPGPETPQPIAMADTTQPSAFE